MTITRSTGVSTFSAIPIANGVALTPANTTGITGALGYTPANKAGDTFTGVVNFSANVDHTANVTIVGRLGVAQTAPADSLHVTGGIRSDLSGATGANYFAATSNATTTATFFRLVRTGVQEWYVGSTVAGGFFINELSVNSFFIKSGGDIGFGTDTPISTTGRTVHITSATGGSVRLSGTNVNAAFVASNASAIAYVGTLSAHPFQIYANNAAVLTVAANGNIGINNAAPIHKLSVNGIAYFQANTNFAANVEFATVPTVNGVAIPMTSADYSQLLFGDGSDGNTTISGNVTLSRDMYYMNLTLDTAASVNAAGYRIFVSSTLDLTNAPAGSIYRNGGNGGDASGSSAGSAGATFSSGKPLGGPEPGTAGSAGSTTAGGLPGIVTNRSYGRIAISGGGGGKGGAGTGANSSTPVTRTSSGWSLHPIKIIDVNQFIYAGTSVFALNTTGISGSGGSGGGGDGTAGGGGGGGGTAGGELLIAAKTVARGSNTAVGCIQAKGGTGGIGANAAAGNRGGGGGGSGGSGGGVILIVGSLTGTTATDAIDVSAGNSGRGGDGTGTGRGAAGGDSGSGGCISVFNLSTLTHTITVGSGSAVIGTAGSGTTGGAGANAATVRASI